VETFVDPLSLAFFNSDVKRLPGAQVILLLSCCDVLPSTWQTLVDDSRDTSTPFSVISFRNPLLLADVPSVLAEFVRNFTNRALFGVAGYTIQHALASGLSFSFESRTAPFICFPGGEPILHFLRPLARLLQGTQWSPSPAPPTGREGTWADLTGVDEDTDAAMATVSPQPRSSRSAADAAAAAVSVVQSASVGRNWAGVVSGSGRSSAAAAAAAAAAGGSASGRGAAFSFRGRGVSSTTRGGRGGSASSLSPPSGDTPQQAHFGSAPPRATPFSNAERNSAVIHFIKGLASNERLERGVDWVASSAELAKALNKIMADDLAEGRPFTPFTVSPAGSSQAKAFAAFRGKYWNWHPEMFSVAVGAPPEGAHMFNAAAPLPPPFTRG